MAHPYLCFAARVGQDVHKLFTIKVLTNYLLYVIIYTEIKYERLVIIMPMVITDIKKEGSTVLVTTDENKVYTIKLATKEVISYSGRKLLKNPFNKAYSYGGTMENNAIFGWVCTGNFFVTSGQERLNHAYWDRIIDNEKFLSYPDLISYERMPEEIPQGYVKFLRDNNLKFSCDTLKKFLVEKSKNLYSNADRKRIENLERVVSYDAHKWFMEHIQNKELIETLLKIMINSAKIFENISQIRNLIYLIDDYGIEHLSVNATITENINALEAIRNKDRNEKIIEQQMKIKELETLFENEKYCIVVPTTMEEFANEGNQQNNCVGSYYHDSIARGENLIYFIRKKENKEKSFETCRFNKDYRGTIEHRAKNNNLASDETRALIYDIDKLIKTLLNK